MLTSNRPGLLVCPRPDSTCAPMTLVFRSFKRRWHRSIVVAFASAPDPLGCRVLRAPADRLIHRAYRLPPAPSRRQIDRPPLVRFHLFPSAFTSRVAFARSDHTLGPSRFGVCDAGTHRLSVRPCGFCRHFSQPGRAILRPATLMGFTLFAALIRFAGEALFNVSDPHAVLPGVRREFHRRGVHREADQGMPCFGYWGLAPRISRAVRSVGPAIAFARRTERIHLPLLP